ncbi:MAG TPA: serine hydrolase domain-containing protein [Rubrivivax sp.]|nr:serine hydrolase domain-containing protein [Rubrivivax sp.]
MTIQHNELLDALQGAMARHNVIGASVALFDQGDLVAAAAGLINSETGVDLTPDTVMHIGSICKVFNATLVMQLVDEGLIDLDECILEYLPPLDWHDGGAAARGISVRMLLNHTSGINGEILPDHGPDEETLEKGVRRWVRLGQLFPPGSEFSYCNAAVSMSGYIVQQIRQKSWYTIVRERIFSPLEMRHSISIPEEAMLFRTAVGHYRDPASPGRHIRTRRALLPMSFGPGGSTVMMSATDLVTFARAHMDGGVGPNGARMLSERSTRAMQVQTVDNAGKGYAALDVGLGWMRSKDGLLNHNGGAPGVTSSLYVHPEKQFAIAILTNSEHGADLIRDIAQPYLRAVSAAPLIGLRKGGETVCSLTRPLQAYIGAFEDVLTRYVISSDGVHLFLTRQYGFDFYDSISTQPTVAARLDHVGGDQFLWRADSDVAGGELAATRLFAFRRPRQDGTLELLCSGLRAYRRVAAATDRATAVFPRSQ